MDTEKVTDNLLRLLSDNAIGIFSEELYQNTDNCKHFYLIAIESLTDYIPNSEVLDSFRANDSGWGHCDRNVIAKIIYDGNIYYVAWLYSGGSCSYCDPDEALYMKYMRNQLMKLLRF